MSTWTYIIPGPAMGKRNITLYGDARGGHFGEMEEPELPAKDMRAFFRSLRDSRQ
jgi:hypothetical protein